MSDLALLFVGAVLLVNGLVFLERVDGKAAIPVNLLTGGLLPFSALLQILEVDPTSPDYAATAFGAAGLSIFGFTYLTVGGNSLFGGSGTALGWFYVWAAGIAAVLAMVNFTLTGNVSMAWLWSAWSVLFTAFFIALTSQAVYLTKAAGVLAILQSVSTATIPALLRISGAWESTSVLLIAIVQIAVVATYIAAAMYWRRAPADTMA